MAETIINAVRLPLYLRPRRKHIGPTLKEYRAQCDATIEEVERVTAMIPEPRMRPGPPVIVKGEDRIIPGKPVIIDGEPLLDEEGEPIISDDEVILGADYETEGPDVEIMVDIERVDQEGTRSNAITALINLRLKWEDALVSWRNHYAENWDSPDALIETMDNSVAAIDAEQADVLTDKEWPLHNPQKD